MAKPTLYKIAPFDKSVGTTVIFQWVGRQMKAINVRFKDSSGEQIYVSLVPIPTYTGSYTIPANQEGLTNGYSYYMAVQVVDMDDVSSDWSDDQMFKCLTTPSFGIKDLTIGADNRIESSSMYFELTYSQAQNELLSTWNMFLYDESRGLLDSTPREQYWANATGHTFSGLVDEKVYFVRATGQTVSGMEIDTGYIEFSVNYLEPAEFYDLEAANDSDQGMIKLQGNIIVVEGVLISGNEPVFLLDGDNQPFAVDLTGETLLIDRGLTIDNDFTMYMKFANPDLYQTFATINGVDNAFKYELKFWKTTVGYGDNQMEQFQVYMTGDNDFGGNNISFSLWSNPLTVTNPVPVEQGVLDVPSDYDGGIANNVLTLDGGITVDLGKASFPQGYTYGDWLGLVLRRHNGVYSMHLYNFGQGE